jgi:hypothetical protein
LRAASCTVAPAEVHPGTSGKNTPNPSAAGSTLRDVAGHGHLLLKPTPDWRWMLRKVLGGMSFTGWAMGWCRDSRDGESDDDCPSREPNANRRLQHANRRPAVHVDLWVQRVGEQTFPPGAGLKGPAG